MILKNTMFDNDSDIQYYLFINAFKFKAEGCLFQLYNISERTIVSLDYVNNIRVIMYILFCFLPPEINYYITE